MTSQPARMTNRAATQATEKGSGMSPRFTFQKTLFFAFAAFVATSSLSASDPIEWQTDLNKAKHQAAAEKKLVLLHFTASWCSACNEIDRFVFANPMTIRTIDNQVIPVQVDIDMQSQIAQEYGVTTVPYDVLITSAGNVIKERPSPRSSDGYRELIIQAKESAATVPKKVIKEVNELRQEARRQRQLRATQNNPFGSDRSASTPVALQDRLQAGNSAAGLETHQPWSATDTRQTPQPNVRHMSEQASASRPNGGIELPSNNAAAGVKPPEALQGSFPKPKPRISYGAMPSEEPVTTNSIQNKFQTQSPNRSEIAQTQEPLATRIVNPLYQRKQAELAAQVAWKEENSKNPKSVTNVAVNPEPQEEKKTDFIPETLEKPMGFSFNTEEPTLAAPYKPAPSEPVVAFDELKKIKNPAVSEPPLEAPKTTLSETAKILPKTSDSTTEVPSEEPAGGSFKPISQQTAKPTGASHTPAASPASNAESKNETDGRETDINLQLETNSKPQVDRNPEPEAVSQTIEPMEADSTATNATEPRFASVEKVADSGSETPQPFDESLATEISPALLTPESTKDSAPPTSTPPKMEAPEAKTPAAFQNDAVIENQPTEVAAQTPSISNARVDQKLPDGPSSTQQADTPTLDGETPTMLTPKPIAQAKPESNVGLEGFCCVSLMEDQKWIKGKETWGCFHRGRLFLFASEKYRDLFQTNPDIYSPLLGGADPVRFHENGDLVDGKREHGVFYGDEGGPTVIVLFSTADTRAKFEKEPTEYLRSVRQAMNRLDSDLLIR